MSEPTLLGPKKCSDGEYMHWLVSARTDAIELFELPPMLNMVDTGMFMVCFSILLGEDVDYLRAGWFMFWY